MYNLYVSSKYPFFNFITGFSFTLLRCVILQIRISRLRLHTDSEFASQFWTLHLQHPSNFFQYFFLTVTQFLSPFTSEKKKKTKKCQNTHFLFTIQYYYIGILYFCFYRSSTVSDATLYLLIYILFSRKCSQK